MWTEGFIKAIKRSFLLRLFMQTYFKPLSILWELKLLNYISYLALLCSMSQVLEYPVENLRSKMEGRGLLTDSRYIYRLSISHFQHKDSYTYREGFLWVGRGGGSVEPDQSAAAFSLCNLSRMKQTAGGKQK